MPTQTVFLEIIVGLIFFVGMISGVYIYILGGLRKTILDLKCDRGIFKARGMLMNMTEHRFFNLLGQFFSEYAYEVFAQVDMAALIGVNSKAVNYYDTLRDLDKSIDFVIVDSETMKPLLAIELDGPDHNKDTRKIRDQFLKRIFSDCGIPFLSVPVILLSNEGVLRQKIMDALHNN